MAERDDKEGEGAPTGAVFRRGVAWVLAGNVGDRVLGFLFGIVLARLLAPEIFGHFLTLQVFTGLAGFIAGGGMGQALVRAKVAEKPDFDIVFTLQLVLGVVIYAVFFFAAPWFEAWYDTPLYTDLLRITALSFLLRPFLNMPQSQLHRAMRYKELSIVRVTALVGSSLVSIAMALLGYGIWSLVIGGIVGSLLSIALAGRMARWRPGLSANIARGRHLASYGLMVSLTDIVNYLRQQAVIFILSRTMGPASVGLYNKGNSLARMPHLLITGSVYKVTFRAMAAEQDNLDKGAYLFFRSIALVAVYATPFYVGLLWTAEPLVVGLYGENWRAAAIPLAILALAWPFWMLGNLAGSVLAARNWLHRELVVQVSSLLVMVLLVLIGLSWGLAGVAVAIVGASVYTAVYMQWLAVQCLETRWRHYLAALLPAVVLNVPLAAFLYALDHLLGGPHVVGDYAYLGAMVVGGAVVYGLLFFALPLPALATERARWWERLKGLRPGRGT